MKRTIISLIILPAMAAANARTVELTIYPAKVPKPAQKYQLLPKADEQIDGDAAPLYEKAIQSLPNDPQMKEIQQWLKTPPDKLPGKQVQSILQQFESALVLLEEAAKYKTCYWPYTDDDLLSENLSKHRRLIFILTLKIRFQIAQGLYDDAIRTAQAGFTMAKNLEKDFSLLRRLVGIGIAAQICRQLEQFVQRPDSPDLYHALQDLPLPFIDLSKLVESEYPSTREKGYLLMDRLDRHMAALKCIEAIRLYAAVHDGKFPEKISDVKLVPVPSDPATNKPFTYTRSGAMAVLEIPPLKGATEKDITQYELHFKEQK